MNYNELKKKLMKAGCYLAEQRSNHEWWYSPRTKQHFPIQRHQTDDIGKKIKKKIRKQISVLKNIK